MKQAQIGNSENCAEDMFHGLQIARLQVAWIGILHG